MSIPTTSKQTLGIIAGRLAIPTLVLDPDPHCPAKQVSVPPPGTAHVDAVYGSNAAQGVSRLAAQCTVITPEIEHIDADALQGHGNVQPAPETIRLVQDKFVQKKHLKARGVPVCDAVGVDTREQAERAVDALGLPLMLKRRAGAYDGRGNFVLRELRQLDGALAALGATTDGEFGLYAERWAPFVKEVAVMVVRDVHGETRSYDPAETVQRENICRLVLAPLRAADADVARARAVAEDAVCAFAGAGVFGVELFLLDGGAVVVNEIAPRVHNGGHWTEAGCATSQFENHVRAVLGRPLGSTAMVARCAAMVNLIGGDWDFDNAVDIAMGVKGASVHVYGKTWRAGRKLGHVNVVADSDAELRARLRPILLAIDDPDVDAYAPDSPERGVNHAFPLVSIVMGSKTDLPVMQKAADVLDEFAIPYEMLIVSAHRTPDRLYAFAQGAEARGVRVIVAGAGGAAHLPGMVAAMSALPVIGVPVKTTALSGVDSLYSIVQMPRGIPVACVAIDNGMNGGLLAARMVGNSGAMSSWMQNQSESVALDPRK
ncbi:phosphoribosylaminoimidazole carboxylase [Exidia glandulosa HHB12029]|uniref:Phosphoribosylaminoimidazole carboxylase n=1 Tax=Exidia glandulosa HHB12029 TaxID=1314781 RepID=A0A166AA70_EXIGL|nr:phosphoribosylaminoimidazole carboxylase [Exidia glandulosa HHB12029]